MTTMSSHGFLSEIAEKTWPLLWTMFAALDQHCDSDPRFEKLLHKVGVKNPLKAERYSSLTEDQFQFMIGVRQSLFMPTLYDIALVLLGDATEAPSSKAQDLFDACDRDEWRCSHTPEEPCDCSRVVISITQESLKRISDGLGRDALTSATGYEAKELDHIIEAICSTVLQILIENGCEIRIHEAPIVYRVPS